MKCILPLFVLFLVSCSSHYPKEFSVKQGNIYADSIDLIYGKIDSLQSINTANSRWLIDSLNTQKIEDSLMAKNFYDQLPECKEKKELEERLFSYHISSYKPS